MEKGVNVFNNNINNQVLKLYYQHLVSFENKSNTINLKLIHIYILERYLVINNKTLKVINKEDVYNYISECTKLENILFFNDLKKIN